jgi:hypothetical protein
MSFLFQNSKKLLNGNNQKISEGNKNLNMNSKIITNKKFKKIDLSQLYSNLKNYNVISPKYNTLRNSRNAIFY